MSVREIRYLGDPVLREMCREVETIDDDIRALYVLGPVSSIDRDPLALAQSAARLWQTVKNRPVNQLRLAVAITGSGGSGAWLAGYSKSRRCGTMITSPSARTADPLDITATRLPLVVYL